MPEHNRQTPNLPSNQGVGPSRRIPSGPSAPDRLPLGSAQVQTRPSADGSRDRATVRSQAQRPPETTHVTAAGGQAAGGQAAGEEGGLICAPGPRPGTVLMADGQVRRIPAGWECLPPGDPGLTRRVKAAGPHWLVQEKRGRKVFSRGLWADQRTIVRLRAELEVERADPRHAKRQAASAARREAKQTEYVGDFEQAVVGFLGFHPRYQDLGQAMAVLITAHATPVGSGTVARTQRLSLEERARAAVIAWMRHQTTDYDQRKIERVKGRRREVRRELAQQSLQLLTRYRQGQPPAPDCPLMAAVSGT